MGHQREEHKKLKERVEATENTVSDMSPSASEVAFHINALQKEVAQLRQQGVCRRQPQADSSREQAAKERGQIMAEMELWAKTPPPPVLSGEWLETDVPELEDEQIHALLGDGPPVTPQTAEDLL
ncbi:hypothetical protein NDU88_004401 [Pleurodeles waltl]|uniref:Uncharacterized protein n=1 Tax=Pleurodeles waltl TaxID=8319 RepID=A0AAV7WRR3_PLEWA|nr:hypothetical protein NDU88_004401 [Pleurodeles waltl]